MIFNGAIFRQTILSIPVILVELTVGIGYGWLAPAINFIQQPGSGINATTEEISWIASMHEVGRFTTPLIFGLLVDKLGRKTFVIVAAGFYTLGWIGITLSKNISIITISRFSFGLGVGIADCVECIYISEFASPSIRGKLLTAAFASYIFGILLELVLSSIFTYDQVAYISLTISAIALLSTTLIIETPQHLIIHKKYSKAKSNLAWLRGKSIKDIESEFKEMEINIHEENRKNLKEIIKDPISLRATIIASGSGMLTSFTGNAVLTTYIAIIFSQIIIDKNQVHSFTILYGALNTIANIATCFIIDKVGRRMLMLTSLPLITIIMFLTSILYFLHEEMNVTIPSYPWVLLVLLVSYSAVYSLGVFPIIFTIRAELFPQSIKGVGVGITVLAASFTNFITIKLFHNIIEAFGTYVAFLIFALFGIISFIFIYLLLPETKGKTLAEIQIMLKNKTICLAPNQIS